MRLRASFGGQHLAGHHRCEFGGDVVVLGVSPPRPGRIVKAARQSTGAVRTDDVTVRRLEGDLRRRAIPEALGEVCDLILGHILPGGTQPRVRRAWLRPVDGGKQLTMPFSA